MRNQRKITLTIILVCVVGSATLSGLTWANYQFSLHNPGGNDFLVHWIGTRSYLIDGLSPYSDETALRIQTVAYGRPAVSGEHELRVAYPIYSMVFYIPFALFRDYTLARALWMTLLELCLILTAFFCLKLYSWRPKILNLVVYFLFSMTWYHAVRPLINGNAVLLVTMLLVGGLLALQKGADELAGFLLALTTIKPNVVVLVIVFIMIWSIINRRWRLTAWLIGTQLILIAIGFFFLPDWILQNLREVIRYPSYNPPGTPGAALATWFPAQGERLGWVVTGIVAVMIIIEWIRARNAGSRGFQWAVCFTLVLSPWSGIQTDPGNFVILFPALVVVLALLDERWRRLGGVAGLLLMLGLSTGLWWLFLMTLTEHGQPMQSPVLFFPLPALLVVLLYWVRWWAFHPVQTWFDLIYDKDNPPS